jgi:dienelactone hydrolase
MDDFRPVRLRHQGADLVGQAIVPSDAAEAPAVLLMPSAMGVSPAYLRIASRLAESGYVALVADVFGDGVYFTGTEEAFVATRALLEDPARVRSRVVAWSEALKALPEVDPGRVGAIGYCLGGRCVLELARSGADIKAVVSFHGTLTTTKPAGKGDFKARVAVYTGALDPLAPQADIDAFTAEMRASEALWHFTCFSDAYHAFTTPEDGALPLPGLGYDPLADAVSWAGTMALLKELV